LTHSSGEQPRAPPPVKGERKVWNFDTGVGDRGRPLGVNHRAKKGYQDKGGTETTEARG